MMNEGQTLMKFAEWIRVNGNESYYCLRCQRCPETPDSCGKFLEVHGEVPCHLVYRVLATAAEKEERR